MSPDAVRRFASEPAAYFGHSWPAMQHLDADELQQLQLEALRLRFTELREQVPALAATADAAGVREIAALDDAVPLLFQHSVYKSYPASLLLRGRFAALTRWLDRLTAHDLGGVDVEGCEGIDDWLDMLDAQTELRVFHTSGTSGTMSFLPRSAAEWDQMAQGMKPGLFQFSDPDGLGGDHADTYFDLVWPLNRRGRSAIMRFPEMTMPHLLGSEDRLHALRPGRMSSDAMFLAARLARARARGEEGDVEISPALRARREEFVAEQAQMAESLPRFITEVARRHGGRRVWLLATWNVLYQLARAGLDAGLEGVFAPDSLISTGGGAKGQVVPDDWEDTVRRFFGVEHVQHGYVMSEITAFNKLCEHGRYHLEPWIVPFLLDPEDGTPAPRRGEHTGRAALFDLVPTSGWGGFITGDEVTMSFERCTCGRTTTHLARSIQRYSDKQGGDDKITCVASEDAQRAALELLAGPAS